MARDKKDLDFELNLIPFISLLSALICSLLLSATLINIGSMNVKHAIGGQSLAETKKVPVVWAHMEEDGGLTFLLKDAGKVSGKFEKTRVEGIDGLVNLDAVERQLGILKDVVPELKTVLIQPRVNSVFEQIIALMDLCKKVGLVDLGIAPL